MFKMIKKQTKTTPSQIAFYLLQRSQQGPIQNHARCFLNFPDFFFERKVWLFFVMCAWSNPEVCKYTTLKGRLDKHNFAQRIKSQFGFSIIKKRLFFLLNSKHIKHRNPVFVSEAPFTVQNKSQIWIHVFYLRSFWGFLRLEQEKENSTHDQKVQMVKYDPSGEKGRDYEVETQVNEWMNDLTCPPPGFFCCPLDSLDLENC